MEEHSKDTKSFLYSNIIIMKLVFYCNLRFAVLNSSNNYISYYKQLVKCICVLFNIYILYI